LAQALEQLHRLDEVEAKVRSQAEGSKGGVSEEELREVSHKVDTLINNLDQRMRDNMRELMKDEAVADL
jgi:hypothetical protein